MKRNITKLLTCILTGTFLLTAGMVGHAEEDTSLLSSIEIRPFSEAYQEYVKDPDKFNGYIPSPLDLSYLNDVSYLYGRDASELPASYDLRSDGLVSSIKDQGSFGTCWAFASLGSAESTVLSRYPWVYFSPRHLAYSSYAFRDMILQDDIMNGGWVQQATATMSRGFGPVSEQSFPYSDEPITEEERQQHDFFLKESDNLFGYQFSMGGSHSLTTVMKNVILEKGALALAYEADFATLNEETNAWYNNTAGSSNHEVVLVGWDDSYSKENFLTPPPDNGAWLIKNSWGTGIQNDGYFWLSYYDQTISDGTCLTVGDADRYDQIYLHDKLGWCQTLTLPGEDSISQANIFTITKDSQIDAVTVNFPDANTSYEVSVYTDTASDNPVLNDQGTPASAAKISPGSKDETVQSGEETFSGYHTIELNNPVPVKNGQRVSVVVKTTSENPFVASELYASSGQFANGGMEPGESFLYDEEDGWVDLYPAMESSVGSLTVRILTNPLETIRYSMSGGPAKTTDQVTLDAGETTIVYTTDGSTPTAQSAVYKQPISMQTLPVTVKASILREDGTLGSIKENTYTPSQAALSSLLVKASDSSVYMDLFEEQEKVTDPTPIYSSSVGLVSHGNDHITLCPISTGSITINQIPIKSGESSQEFPLNYGNNPIQIAVKEEGKADLNYTANIVRNPITYDYDCHLISSIEPGWNLYDGETQLSVGSDLSPYFEQTLTLTNGQDNYPCKIPYQFQFTNLALDYVNEMTNFSLSPLTYYSYNENMEDAIQGDLAAIPVIPGTTIYLQRKSDGDYFSSEITELAIPKRQEISLPVKIEKIGQDYVAILTIEGGEYRIGADGEFSNWQREGIFRNLQPGKEYTIEQRLASTKNSFFSETASLTIKTEEAATDYHLSYQAHVANDGWLDWVNDGALAGTTGRSLRMEAAKLKLTDGEQSISGIRYRTHVANDGWLDWVSDGEMTGTIGKSLRMEAIEITLSDELAAKYDVVYRAHVNNKGWLDWVKNGETAGTTGESLRIEALEVKLVSKNN